jgi:hypothetical protein
MGGENSKDSLPNNDETLDNSRVSSAMSRSLISRPGEDGKSQRSAGGKNKGTTFLGLKTNTT